MKFLACCVLPERFQRIECFFYHSGFVGSFALALRNRVWPRNFSSRRGLLPPAPPRLVRLMCGTTWTRKISALISVLITLTEAQSTVCRCERQWRVNYRAFSTCYWVASHLLLPDAWYVSAKVLRRLHGIKHRLLQQLYKSVPQTFCILGQIRGLIDVRGSAIHCIEKKKKTKQTTCIRLGDVFTFFILFFWQHVCNVTYETAFVLHY